MGDRENIRDATETGKEKDGVDREEKEVNMIKKGGFEDWG